MNDFPARIDPDETAIGGQTATARRLVEASVSLQIKFRESFRPFAPAVLRDRCSDYFALRPDDDRPYMSIVAPVAEARRRPVDSDGRQGFDRLRAVRSDVPAVTHVDYSARLQTVDVERPTTRGAVSWRPAWMAGAGPVRPAEGTAAGRCSGRRGRAPRSL